MNSLITKTLMLIALININVAVGLLEEKEKSMDMDMAHHHMASVHHEHGYRVDHEHSDRDDVDYYVQHVDLQDNSQPDYQLHYHRQRVDRKAPVPVARFDVVPVQHGFDSLPDNKAPTTFMAPNPQQDEPEGNPKRFFLGPAGQRTWVNDYDAEVNFKAIPDIDAPVTTLKEVVNPDAPVIGSVEEESFLLKKLGQKASHGHGHGHGHGDGHGYGHGHGQGHHDHHDVEDLEVMLEKVEDLEHKIEREIIMVGDAA